MKKVSGVEILKPPTDSSRRVLTEEALKFLTRLARVQERFRRDLLVKRVEMQKRYDAGELPDFCPDTEHIRKGDWKVAELPECLLDRRVEITGPTDRKMVINALNSAEKGTNVFMADFEDSNSPTWGNMVEGQANLYDAVRRTIEYDSPKGHYALNKKTAMLMVRPRGLHLPEKHLLVDDVPISASLFDFGLFFFHNAREMVRRGEIPCLYLPKLESYEEAAWWDNVIGLAEAMLNIPVNTTKVTVLVETLPAVFQMHEILFAFQNRAAGLNRGYLDYSFSAAKVRRMNPKMGFPDLAPYMKAIVQTAHVRGVLAIGGMTTRVYDMERVRADKRHERELGFDGSWYAHPGQILAGKEEFNLLSGVNQVNFMPEGEVTREDLLAMSAKPLTKEEFFADAGVEILYVTPWICGTGCVQVEGDMHDVATVEMRRMRDWHAVYHRTRFENGEVATPELFRAELPAVLERIRNSPDGKKYPWEKYERAAKLVSDTVLAEHPPEFFTLAAYDEL